MRRWYGIAGSVLLALGLGLGNAACDTSGAQEEFAERAFREDPGGITYATRSGVDSSRGIDEDDWRIAPDYQFGGIVYPAYPNPTYGSEITLTVQMGIDTQKGNSLTLCTRDANEDLLFLDAYPVENGPSYTFIVSPAQLPTNSGLRRLFVLDTNGANCRGRLVSYGDVRIE